MTFVKSILILLVLVLSSVLSILLKPNELIVDLVQLPNFEEMIPRQFGIWKIDSSIPMVLGDPALESKLNAIYSQNLSRTYVNDEARIMLSIAYGVDQSDSMQVHKPEVCYPAQGFVINSISKGTMDLDFKQIPVTYLDTEKNFRREFVTYWILVGDQVVDGGLERKLKQLEYGLQGITPDGLLFRVSSIGIEMDKELRNQKQFIVTFLRFLEDEQRVKLIGS